MTTSVREENYSLRWNNHQSHILESFDALLQQNSLVDVTLVCADRSLRAHKVVLSACSPFFEKVFNDTPCKHPTIVLKDFKGWLVQAIVDFMYRGEISVQQERLSQLIQAAESLQIRGLVTAVPIAIASEVCEQQQLERENNCNSPMPRRKQARPRRRSGDLADLQPQDLSNGQVLKCETEIDSDDDDEADDELHELAKHVRQNGNSNNNIDDDDDDDNESAPTDDNDEKENQPESEMHVAATAASVTDVPQNLCTKRSTPDDDEVGNDKNNNNDGNGSKKSRPQALPPHDFHERFILSLKDLRHLNRYRQGPPGHPFNDLLSHLPISPPPSFQMPSHENNQRDRENKEPMKIESDHSDAETPPYPDHLDHLPPHPNFPQTPGNDKRENHHKMPPHLMGPGMPGPFPPPFQQQGGNDGSGPMSRHHHGQHPPHSPLPFPPMPSVSALTLTPPHMFGLDSPLGLFPPGMDPSKMYNPLMDLPDHHGHRGIHPDAPPFLKKKLQRPKGQHSAPRGGPPRSWTNAELTEALQHVWNKKMTTSQASRIFGIPYNSLLMYVRGKYGKSLKLEQLRKDCISGPPIEMLQMNPAPSGEKKKEKSGNNSGNHDENHDGESPRKSQEHHGPRRSASSDPDMMNPLFNPFPGGFYPDFPGAAGFPGLQLSMLNLLPPDARLPQPMMPMVIDDDCKSDTGSVQSLEDSLPPTPLNLNREKNGNGHESSPIGRQMFPN
ncbi:hypothetical protein PVAND_017391 [Polypedilum vanderplanki]|uniref:Protein jim lovell n=1 Tax=Polypedilum vanderplanki TaxID=319348 RepID=A0A9J6BIJ3_POLVA|nr:hypothetical protein PVAND_017391 [Polypedilum vanderplanki]